MKKLFKELNKVIEQLDIDVNDFYSISIDLDYISFQGHKEKNELLIAQLRKLKNIKEKDDGFLRIWYKNIVFVFSPLF